MTFILAIDQGTTSTRAILFDKDMKVVDVAQKEFPQHFPQAGWVEHEVEDLWETTLSTCRDDTSQSSSSLPWIVALLGLPSDFIDVAAVLIDLLRLAVAHSIAPTKIVGSRRRFSEIIMRRIPFIV